MKLYELVLLLETEITLSDWIWSLLCCPPRGSGEYSDGNDDDDDDDTWSADLFNYGP